VLPFYECHGFSPFFFVKLAFDDPKKSNPVPLEKVGKNKTTCQKNIKKQTSWHKITILSPPTR
jgi:hypothetical protein